MPELSDGILIVSDEDTLPNPPVAWAYVAHWAGCPLEFDLEIWADEAVEGSDLQLLGGTPKPVTLADDDVDAVVHASDQLTVNTHAYRTGDGPVRLTSSGTLPTGLAAATDYWIGVVDSNTIQLYASFAAVMSGGDPVEFSSTGSGTHTISDTDETKRVHWMSYGYIGHDASGALTLDEQLGYADRIAHRPRTVAYAIVGTVDEPINAEIYLVRPVRN